MTHMDNPAGRLLHWLRDTAGSYSDQQQPMTAAWSALIGVDHQTAAGRARLLRHAALLADQCVEVRNEVAALNDAPVDPGLLLEHFAQVETAVGYFTNMDNIRLHSQLDAIDGTGQYSLKLLDSTLHRYRGQLDVHPAVVEDLTTRVTGLLEDLGTADVDDDVRDFVRVRFDEVLQALRDSTVAGTKVVEGAIDTLRGNYERQPTLWRKTMESSLGTVIGGIILQLIMNFTGLTPTGDALPPGTPAPIIEQTVQVVVEGPDTPPVTDEAAEGDDDVVDAELVDEDPSESPDRRPAD